MWAVGVGGIITAWCIGTVVAWGSNGSMGILLPISLVVGGLSAMFLGVTLTISAHVMLSAKHKVTPRVSKEIKALHALTSTIKCDSESSLPNRQGVVISRKIDAAINEIMDCFIKHNVTPWYTGLVHDTVPSIDAVRSVLWYNVIILNECITKMDQVPFLTCGIAACLTQHLESIRVAQQAGEARGERGIFSLVPQLSSPERERNFLRLVAEFLISRSLPPEYSQCTPLRTLLKELLACQVFEPLIDRICDPDWINQRLVSYLRQQQAAEELHRRTYMYAASYEDFITLIHDSTDIHDLEHLRRNIINEIMQATAINNLKKAKGQDISKESSVPQGSGKGDLLQARNLKRYINQLTYAKAQCERRIKILNNKAKEPVRPSTFSVTAGNDFLEENDKYKYSLQNLPGRKILMFQVLLESPFARHYFAIYLDEIGQGALLSFWTAVHELRSSEKRSHPQLGTEIFYTYLAPTPPPIKVDKITLRGVESFLLGNRGPEVLYEIGEELERKLEERHYTGFLVSSTYHAMLHQASLQGVDFMTDHAEEGRPGIDSGSCDSLDIPLQLSDHSTYARNKLAHIQERLTNKLLALQAMRASCKCDSKVLCHLESEISRLRAEHKQLEAHVERTAFWSDNIGRWRVHVQNVQLVEDKDVPHLVLLVHLGSATEERLTSPCQEMSSSISDESSSTASPSTPHNSPQDPTAIIQGAPSGCGSTTIVSNNSVGSTSNNSNNSSTSTTPSNPFATTVSASWAAGDSTGYATSIPGNGWVVIRKLPLLVDLHRKLCQIGSYMKSVELPGIPSKISFGKVSDKTYLEKVRSMVQHYFDVVMQDEKLCGSELLYAFLSPSPEHLKQLGSLLPKKAKFSFSTLFKGNEGKSDDEDLSGLMMEESQDLDGGKDDIAEPLFDFLEELCELRGVSKWLRKTLISFVQITYGKTINRHIHETVSGMMSESMILYYVNTIKDNIWPEEDEEIETQENSDTEEDKLKIRAEAREQFVNNIPVLLSTLVGQQNARCGANKLFTTLQHHALNKNLFYNIFEVLLRELFPELQAHMDKKL